VRVAALFLGLMAGLFALLAPSALKLDLMSRFLDAWTAMGSERSIGLIVWYAIPAIALLGGVLATVTPGFAAVLLTVAAAGWAGIGLLLPDLFDYKLLAPAAAAGLAALLALIAGELDIRRHRVARRNRRAATDALADEDHIEREAALRMDPVLVPRSQTPRPAARSVPLTIEDVSATERPAGPPPRWQDLDTPADVRHRPDAWGEARREPAAVELMEPNDQARTGQRQGFRWDRMDTPQGQRFEPGSTPAPRLEPRRAEPVRQADPLRVEHEMWPEEPREAAVAQPVEPPRRRRSALMPVLAAFAAVVILGGLAAGGYVAYRAGWVDRMIALVQPQQAPAGGDTGVVEAATPAAKAPAVPTQAAAVPSPAPAPVAAAPTQLAAATPAAKTFNDPFAYCRAVGTIDYVDGRYSGPNVTREIVRALSLTEEASRDRVRWRCLRGSVLACASYAGPICDMTPTASEMRAYCATHPEVPELVAPAGTWACSNGRVQIPGGTSWPVDERGFLPTGWVPVPSSAG